MLGFDYRFNPTYDSLYTGQPITKIYGNASAGILDAIEAGRFNSKLYEQTLARRLGGEWKVEISPRPSGWNITATRIGG